MLRDRLDVMPNRYQDYLMSIDVPAGKIGRHDIDLSSQVAEEIRVLMTRRRVSGRRLATLLGVSPAWISYRLTGSQPIDLNDLQRIAEAFGVDAISLIPRKAGAMNSATGDTKTFRSSGPRTKKIVRPVGPGRPVDGRPAGHSSGGRRPTGQVRTSRVY